jgi:ribosomal protein S20
MIRHVAAKGVIPKKRASRKIARLARRIHAAQA